MINVLCWSPESTTYQLRSEHIRSIFSISLHTHNLLPPAFPPDIYIYCLFVFFKFSFKMQPEGRRRRSGHVAWVQGAGRVPGCTAYVACVGLSGSHIRVYYMCDEYMPSRTERNDEHFRASLITAPSVTSRCSGPFASFFYPCFQEAQITLNVNRVLGLFSYSRVTLAVLQRNIQWPVCAFSFHSDLLTLIPEVSLSGLLYPRGGSGKVPKCPVLLWIIIQIPKGILTVFALPRSSVPWRRLRLLAADLCVGEHWKIWLRAPRLARNPENGNT